MTNTTKPTLATLTAEYNQLVAKTGGKPIKKFTCSLSKAMARVEQLRATVKPKRAKNPDAKPRAKREGTIKQVALGLIADGVEPASIVEQVLKQFPEAKFNVKHVYWYRAAVKAGKVA